MPASPVKSAPPPAPYVEECDDSDDDQPAAPPVANSARKVTRRDEASDSGYSSHTYATGSSSQGSRRKSSGERSGILKVFGMGKKQSQPAKKPSSPEKSQTKTTTTKATRRQSIARTQKTSDLRSSAQDAKLDVPKKRPTVPPIETKIIRPAPDSREVHAATAHPVRRPSVGAVGQPVISVPHASRPRLYSTGSRPRPSSYSGGHVVLCAPSPTQYYHPAYVAAPQPIPIMAPPPPMPQYQMPAAQVAFAPGPNSPTRMSNYHNVMPTHPPSYFAPNPGQQQYWHQSLPNHARRMSMSAAPEPIVEYPQVPQTQFMDPWAPRGQPMRVPEYPVTPPSPVDKRSYVDYNPRGYPTEAEAFYLTTKQREDKRSMPPPAIPRRPSLGRSQTTSAANVTSARRSSRASIEIPSRSTGRTSIEESRNRPPSRANASKRMSQSSVGSAREVASIEPPSPTSRRRSRIISPPSPYQDPPETKHDTRIRAAEAYQEAQMGDTRPRDITTELVQRALREKPEGKSRSSKSHSSRTSSKNGDQRRSRHSHSDKPREKHESGSVKLRIGEATFDPRGRSFDLRQTGDDVQIRMKSGSESKDDRARRLERGSRDARRDSAYSQVAEEIDLRRLPAPTRSQSGRRHTHDVTASALADRDYHDYPDRSESRSRRSSRIASGTRRPVVRVGNVEYI